MASFYSKSRDSITKLNKISNRIKKILHKQSATIAKQNTENPINTIFIPTTEKRINLVFERAEAVEKLSKAKQKVSLRRLLVTAQKATPRFALLLATEE